ncbi:MAG TPA: ABC transporter permease, partial [Sulfitobacter pontiacus]|nr:ABC transporter permease [Sulfitobacter pontiacus]
MIWLVFVAVAWAFGMWVNIRLARLRPARWVSLAAPLVFGATLIAVWEGIVRGLEISQVLLPAPSLIALRLVSSLDILWVDFVQTVLKGALSGYVLGCGAAFLIAVAIDRFPFLQRGLLPV